MNEVMKASRALVMSVYQLYLGAKVEYPGRKKTMDTRVIEVNINDANPWVGTGFWLKDGGSEVPSGDTLIFQQDEQFWKEANPNLEYKFIEDAKLCLRPLDVKHMPKEDKDNLGVLLNMEPIDINIAATLKVMFDNSGIPLMPTGLMHKDKFVFSYFKILSVFSYLSKRNYNLPLPLPFDSIAGKTPVELGLATLQAKQ